MNPKKYLKGFGSKCVHDIRDVELNPPHNMALHLNSSFDLENVEEGMAIYAGKKEGYVYGRYGNPTIKSVTQKIARLETFGTDIDAFGLFTSSGMSAISTLVLALCNAGDAVLTQENLYGGTTELLQKITAQKGIINHFTNLNDPAAVEHILQKNNNIKLLYFETPANPTLACLDIVAISKIAKKYNCITAIDNTFATPYIQRPLTLGTDFVIHSTTKYMNGHGTGIAGIIVGKVGPLYDKVWKTMKLLGTNGNPFDAWLVNNGLKTLKLRMEAHCRNAMSLAEYLSQQNNVVKVNYPGLPDFEFHKLAKTQMSLYGGMLSFELKGGLIAGIKFMNALKMCSLAPTLGDVDTLVLHPATMSHQSIPEEIRIRNGITNGLIRMSVGIEDLEDLIDDVNRGLEAAG